jgi:hypothetical protein
MSRVTSHNVLYVTLLTTVLSQPVTKPSRMVLAERTTPTTRRRVSSICRTGPASCFVRAGNAGIPGASR